MPKKPIVTAIAICKNEADNLIRWWCNVAPISDNVILVDTGSEDGTHLAARKLGIEVETYFPPKDKPFSFADARNAAFACVPDDTDWLIFTDVDEVFDEPSGLALSEMLREEKLLRSADEQQIDAIRVTLHNIGENGEIMSISKNINYRIIRWRKGAYKFTSDLHEQLNVLDRKDSRSMLTNPELILNHYGYTKSAVNAKGKGERNIAIIEPMLKENPDDLRLVEQYANALTMAGKHEEAEKLRLSHLQQITECQDSELVIRMMRNLMIQQYTNGKKNFDRFLAFYALGNALNPKCPDYDYLFADFCKGNGWIAAAQTIASICKNKWIDYQNVIGETCVDIGRVEATIKECDEIMLKEAEQVGK